MTAALLGAFVTAKLLSLTAGLAWTPATVLAYVWQDVAAAVALGFALDRIRARRWRLLASAAVVMYTALNVPLARIVGSPFTWSMWDAAGGALAGSVAHAATPANLVRIAAVLSSAIASLVITRAWHARVPLAWRRVALALSLAIAATGAMAGDRVDTATRHRNAVVALWPRTSLPVTHAAGAAIDVRESALASPREDLTALQGAARGLNVLVVILESTAAQYLGAYGATDDPMPRLTALAERALVFDHAYTVYPESIRSLYSVLCGHEPSIDAAPEAFAADRCAAMPAAFADAGYRTGLFHSGRFGYLGMDDVIRNRGFDTLEDAGAIGGRVESSFGVDEASTTSRLLRWIDERPGAPFLAMYLPAAGHHPYGSAEPGPFPTRTDFDRYRNALHESDAALGRVIDGLRARGLESRTVVVVFGDHGEAFGQHTGNYAHASFLFEENVRVPYIIAMPGLLAGTRRIDRVASVIDTAPTLLALAGLNASAADSRPGAPAAERSLLDSASRAALFFTDYTSRQVGVRDGCWKAVADLDAGRTRLFDVCADPGEVADRAAAEPARAGREEARLRAWIDVSLRRPN